MQKQPAEGELFAQDPGYSIDPHPILSGDGPKLIHAAVAHNPTPQSAPAGLADLVVPVRDAHGYVTDWKLAAADEPRTKAEFSRWHDGFVTDAVICDVATARGLMNWARGRTDLSELGILRLPHARISVRHARKLAWQLHAAADLCGKVDATGIGICAREDAGLARGFVASEGPVMLLSDGGTWVAAGGAGLLLHTGGPEPMDLHVTGWSVTNGNVTAHTADQGDVDLWTSPAAKMLTKVAPGLSTAVVRRVPLTTVYAGLFVTLADMALLASLGNTSLLIDRAGSLPT
ncbi:MAG TPA: hypothetical protein VGH11_03795 [Jatrophihabitans sp.]|jgi:hypothetical protein